MSCNQPITNKDFLSSSNFSFSLHKAPHINFFITEANIPSLSTGVAEEGSPLSSTIPYQGDHPAWGDFEITFVVDEDMKSYLELWEWLVGITFPQTYQQYKRLKRGDQEPKIPGVFLQNRKGYTESDATLFVYTNKSNKQIEVTFKDLYPISVSEIKFSSTLSDVEYATATASFKFLVYTIKPGHYYPEDCD